MALELQGSLTPNELYDLIVRKTEQKEIDAIMNGLFSTVADVNDYLTNVQNDEELIVRVQKYLLKALEYQKFKLSLSPEVASILDAVELENLLQGKTDKEVNQILLNNFSDKQAIYRYVAEAINKNPKLDNTAAEKLRSVLDYFNRNFSSISRQASIESLRSQSLDSNNPKDTADKIKADLRQALLTGMSADKKAIFRRLKLDFLPELGLERVDVLELINQISDNDARELAFLSKDYPVELISVNKGELVFATVYRTSKDADKNSVHHFEIEQMYRPKIGLLASIETLKLIETKYPQVSRVWQPSPEAGLKGIYNYYLDGEVLSDGDSTRPLKAYAGPKMIFAIEYKAKLPQA